MEITTYTRKRARGQKRARIESTIVTTENPPTGPNRGTRVINTQIQRPPGQGLSRSARKRRNRKKGYGTLGSGSNPYLESLMDPENHPGCRIPDLVTIPSSTFQLTFDGTVSPGSAGDGVLVLVNPSNFYSAGNNANPIQIWNNAAAGGVYTSSSQQGWASGGTVAALYDQLRPVSGVLYAEFIGSSLNDSGQICMGWLPRVSSTTTPISTLVVGAGNFTSVIAQSFTKTIPLRNGAVIRWKPMDNGDLEYCLSAQGNRYNESGTNYFPSLFFATAGQSPLASIRFRAVFNYEAIPTADTLLLLSPESSEANLPMLEKAMNWASGAYNNLSAFVGTVSPYVQPVLGRIITNQSQALLMGAMSNRGNSLRLQY